MNELFQPVNAQAVDELRFNGDYAGFVNSEFTDFMVLISGNVVWMTQNIFVCQTLTHSDTLRRLQKQHQGRLWCLIFNFDQHQFSVGCLENPKVADIRIFDMLLESQSRRGVLRLNFFSDFEKQRRFMQVFSSEAFERFLAENEQLILLALSNVTIEDEICEMIGRVPHRLDMLLALEHCVLDVQRFVNTLGANITGGPGAIELNRCRMQTQREPFLSFRSTIVPLLRNPLTKTIYLLCPHRGTTPTDFSQIQAAFKSNQGLEELYISGDIGIRHRGDLLLLFQAIAAAPELRTLTLQLEGAVVLAQEICEMFAKALQDCENKSLDLVKSFDYGNNHPSGYFNVCNHDFWKQTVLPILQFNYERRRFLASVVSCTDGSHLVRALMHAEKINNYHLHFWLVRNHAGDLRVGESVRQVA
jgi:hypothetical protein